MNTITYDPKLVGKYIRDAGVPAPNAADAKGVGKLIDGELVAGVLYTNMTKRELWCHIAAKPGVNWIDRAFLYEMFKLPFVTLGRDQINVLVAASNERSKKFVTHLGFTQKSFASGDGGILYTMTKDECPYLDPESLRVAVLPTM